MIRGMSETPSVPLVAARAGQLAASSPSERLAHIEREILAEKVAALARIAGVLEGLLAHAERVRAQAAVSSGDERRQQLEAHEALRQRARLYRWYLEVQRESLGLLNHQGLDEAYPLPAPLLPHGPRDPSRII